jgi:hypothetical protein
VTVRRVTKEKGRGKPLHYSCATTCSFELFTRGPTFVQCDHNLSQNLEMSCFFYQIIVCFQVLWLKKLHHKKVHLLSKSLIILPIHYKYRILQNIKEQNYLVFFFLHQFFFSFPSFQSHNLNTTCFKQRHDHTHEIIPMRLSSNTSNVVNKFLLSSKPFIKPSFLHQVVKPNAKLCSFWFFFSSFVYSLAIFVSIAFCDPPSYHRRCNFKTFVLFSNSLSIFLYLELWTNRHLFSL